MDRPQGKAALEALREEYPEKFANLDVAFGHIHRGHTIFISTACGEPQFLVHSMIEFVESHPKAFSDAEVLHVWTLGVAPYADAKFEYNFRHNSFFVSESTRDAVNQGLADYTPLFLSEVPKLFRKRRVPIDIALIQTSLPDAHGYMSLGVAVDITKAATEMATTVIAQTNAYMPRVLGDSFVHIDDVDFVVPHDEPLLEYEATVPGQIAQRIGAYVSRIVQDGDTIQVGYGSLPNAILANLFDKKHLGVHTELLSNGVAALMKAGVVDNSRKTIDRGKTVATFCMGKQETYDYLHDNPGVEFREIGYTNSPLTIAKIENMTAINSALQIDLTGQASAVSLGQTFYSGIGGQADFMRGTVLAPGGRTILALPSTARDGEVSRIVPVLAEGAGVTLIRGDLQYVITEFGIAYLHGKNIRERAMALAAIAHPKFRSWLITEAKKRSMVFKDQAFIAGKRGEYPEELESYRTTRVGLDLLIRPVKISDEPLVKDFFCSLSDESVRRRFMSSRTDMPHERLQDFVIIDYTKEMVMLAIRQDECVEQIVGLGQYGIHEQSHTAEVALVVRDDHQDHGVGTELLEYLTQLARSQGLLGFTAEVLFENAPMLHMLKSRGYSINRTAEAGVIELRIGFRGTNEPRST
ncbi:GNAT family N-acetyltransferase [bacterium]|nr:GNAT family N-acetyltransferase [bacterium]